MKQQSVRDIQIKILEVMKFIDKVCRENNITYFIMGGTALGAVRHGGFIPWDDDLDIFMTPQEYAKFKVAFEKEKSDMFVLQEWNTVPEYLEYAKVRMNGTTLIEHQFRHRRDLHQGIYVDIMILHKVPTDPEIQKKVFYQSKFVTLLGISERGWKPKTKGQWLAQKTLKLLPCKAIARWCYKNIYKYEDLEHDFMWCYWITPASFKKGLFKPAYFQEPVDVPFEDTKLLGSKYMKEYLAERYGDYMKLPPIEQQQAAIHAEIFDTEKDYREYL